MTVDQQRDCYDFYAEIKESLAINSLRALSVAGGISAAGKVLNMSKGELSQLGNLSKGTVTSLTSSTPDEAVPNLETLCKLAYTLTVSYTHLTLPTIYSV